MTIVSLSAIYYQKNFKKSVDKISDSKVELNQKTTTPSDSPPPAPSKTPQYDNSSDFNYPNSTLISGSNNNFTLQSTDDPKTITDWYKNKIRSLNMNIQTFVVTNTNGQVLNKLVSANSEKKINVEIKKEPDSNKTQISVTLAGF